ncbi:MAG: GWxTD domain-containing protein [Bacteroidetes bacterium]|nr:GWxTD domain-containing protein [Bacteroidota bacterium]
MKCLTAIVGFKRFLKLIVAIILLASSLVSQAGLKAYLSYSTFSAPQTGPYIETYLTVIGQSIIYKKNSKGKFQGVVEVSLLFKQNDSIKAAQKYNLHSKEIDDTTGASFENFIDQQRFALPNGTYDFEIEINDKNRNTPPYKWTEKVNINYISDKIIVSDIELLESYTKSTTQSVLTKSGYDLIPYVSDFYPDNFNRLAFYCEIYNTKQVLGENERIVVNYSIRSAETMATMNDFGSFSTQKTEQVNVLLGSFNINNLPSGNYFLSIEVKDKNNLVLVSKKRSFQRKNRNIRLNMQDLTAVNTLNSFVAGMTSRDSLIDNIKSLRPIATDAEKAFIDENITRSKSELLQQFFLNFWKTRNESYPESEWKKYFSEVKKVNANFSAINIKGYDTDRGRVYLQYGPPDSRITSDSEVGAYPYEMWQYFKLKSQTSRIFVFYNPDFVSSNYKLLHSDALGELNNPNWRTMLHKGDPQNSDPNFPSTDDYYGNRSNQNYLNSK